MAIDWLSPAALAAAIYTSTPVAIFGFLKWLSVVGLIVARGLATVRASVRQSSSADFMRRA